MWNIWWQGPMILHTVDVKVMLQIKGNELHPNQTLDTCSLFSVLFSPPSLSAFLFLFTFFLQLCYPMFILSWVKISRYGTSTWESPLGLPLQSQDAIHHPNLIFIQSNFSSFNILTNIVEAWSLLVKQWAVWLTLMLKLEHNNNATMQPNLMYYQASACLANLASKQR